MLKSLILIALCMNIAFARDQFTTENNQTSSSGKSRFSSEDKKRFLDDVKQGIAEHKLENKGRVDLQIIKPGFYAELEESLKQEKFTRDEMVVIKQHYEMFSMKKMPADRVEENFYAFVESELEEISKRPLEKIREGGICNNWSCGPGLKCAPHPIQEANGKLKKAGNVCAENSECASGECVEETAGSKKKVCEDVFVCFKPLSLGQSCAMNPVCGAGSCLPFSSLTSGIGECLAKDYICKKNSDCCSNLCSGGTCRANVICKDCQSNGQKPQRGQKCCEGLYLNENGMCAPDVPPSVIPQVRVSPIKSFLISLSNFFISSADAGEILRIQDEFDKFMSTIEGGPGTRVPFGNGFMTIGLADSVTYTSSKGGGSVPLSEKSNIFKVAQHSDVLRIEMMTKYGIDPLGLTKANNDKNKAALDSLITGGGLGVAGIAGPAKSVDIAGLGSVSYNPGYPGNDNNEGVPSSITGPSGTKYSPASEFYNSNEYAAIAGTKMQADDYEYLNDEKIAATKTAQSAETDGSAAAALEDEQNFLNLGVANDGLDLKSGIMNDQEKYKNFVATSKESKALNMDEKKAKMAFNRKSNFATCDIKFKDDFYNALKADGTFDLEVAMLGFDFVITGDSEYDYWSPNQTADTSIYGRLKKIGVAHKLVRTETNNKIDNINKKLTCMCLDVQGYAKITDPGKKKFFETSCEEYEKYKNPETGFDELEGDASGLKAKRLLVIWTTNLAAFHTSLTVDNNAAYTQLLNVSNWANSEAKWSTAKTRNYDLFKFSIKNPSGSVAGLGAIVGALLAAGILAIMGGFATTSILSAWAISGIIAASAATGAGGLWMIATLKGAWITQSPQISDSVVAPRSYSCGKKETCMEYTRTLVQPYNEVCNIHTSSNACIKSFVVINEDKEARFIVDPWIPVGISKESILNNQPLYTDKLERGFEAARNNMVSKNPGATGGGGKKGGGEFVSESYLSEVFIDAGVIGSYTPAIGNNIESNYFLNLEKIKMIKEAAKNFAIKEGFLLESDTANLKEFADYAYEYHFVWPKKSRPGEVSYPTVGLSTYLNYMAKNVSGSLTTGLAGTAIKLNKLNEQYLKDYKNNLLLFIEKPVNQNDVAKKALLNKELDKVNKDLDGLITLNSMLDNKNLDSQLSTLNSSFVASQSKLAGVNGSVGLSGDQSNFIKAVGNLRTTRKAQLKSLDTYNKAMAANGDKERTVKMASVSKKFSDNFSKGNSAFGTGSRLGSSSSSSSDSPVTDPNANGNGSGGYGSGNGSGGAYGAGSNGLYGSSGGSSSGASKTGADSADANGAGSAEDQNKISDAIDARNKQKNKYDSNDGQTLFEKVTNAYIRNYDKVLSKKKDKDVIEEKQ